jgi:hypothetical protein
LICICMVFLDDLVQYFLFIAMIDLSRSCDSSTDLICYASIMFMIHPKGIYPNRRAPVVEGENGLTTN